MEPIKQPIKPESSPTPSPLKGGESPKKGTETTQDAFSQLKDTYSQSNRSIRSKSIVRSRPLPPEIAQLQELIKKEVGSAPHGEILLNRLNKLPPRFFPFLLEGLKKLDSLFSNELSTPKIERMLDLCDTAGFMNFSPDSTFTLDQFIPPYIQDMIFEIDFRILVEPFKTDISAQESIAPFKLMGNMIQVARESEKKEIIRDCIKEFIRDVQKFPLYVDGYNSVFSKIVEKEIPIDQKLKRLKDNIITAHSQEIYDFWREAEIVSLIQKIVNPYIDNSTKVNLIINGDSLIVRGIVPYLKEILPSFTEEQRCSIIQRIIHCGFPSKVSFLSLESKLKLFRESYEQSEILFYILDDPHLDKKSYTQLVKFILKEPLLRKFLKDALLKKFFEGPSALCSHAELIDFLEEGVRVGLFTSFNYSFLEELHVSKEEFLRLVDIQKHNKPYDKFFEEIRTLKGEKDNEGIYKLTFNEKLDLIVYYLEKVERDFGLKMFGDDAPSKEYDTLLSELPLEILMTDPSISNLSKTTLPSEREAPFNQLIEDIIAGLSLYAAFNKTPPEIPENVKDIIIKQNPLLALYLYPEVFVSSPEKLEILRRSSKVIADLLTQEKPHPTSFKWLGMLGCRLKFFGIEKLDKLPMDLFSGVLRLRIASERYKFTDYIFRKSRQPSSTLMTRLQDFQENFGKKHNILFGFLLATFFEGDIPKQLAVLSNIKDEKVWKRVYAGLSTLAGAWGYNFSNTAKSRFLLNLIGPGKVDLELFVEEMSLLPALFEREELNLFERAEKEGPGSVKKCLTDLLVTQMGIDIDKYKPRFESLSDLYHKVFEDPKIRKPSAIFLFAFKINSLNDEKLTEALKKFVDSIIRGGTAFQDLRYDEKNNPQLQAVFKDKKLKEEWKRGEVLPLDEFISSYSSSGVAFQDRKQEVIPFQFFSQRLQEAHLILTDFPGLTIFAHSLRNDNSKKTKLETLQLIDKAIEKEKAAKNPDPNILKQLKFSISLVRFYGLKVRDEQLAFFKEEIDPFIDEIFPDSKHSQFKADLLFLKELLETQKKFTSLKGFTIEDSDDWQDILLSGTEVQGSCQSLDGDPLLMQGIEGALLRGEIRLILIRHPSGEIVGRRLIRLLSGEKSGSEILYKERLYKDLRLTSEMEEAIDHFFVHRAKSMKRDVVTEGRSGTNYPEGVKSLESNVPIYVDGGAQGIVPAGKSFIIPQELLSLVYSASKGSNRDLPDFKKSE